MSTPAFNFDFSSLNPYITGLANRSMQAMDYRLEQMPVQDRLNRRAYAEWLNNNASKRAIAEGDADLRRRGFDAAEALGQRQEKQAAQDRFSESQEKRRAFMASHAASQASYGGGNYGSGAGVTRDFYTYGPWARGGRGGGNRFDPS